MSIQRSLEAIHDRIMLMLSRGTLERVDDSDDFQKLQVSIYEGDVLEDMERVGQWGFASNPPTGSGIIAGFLGGHRSHGVILGVDDRARPRLQPGETAIWNNFGCVIRLKANGDIDITPGATMVTINGNVTITGNLQVDGTLNGHAP